MKARIFTTAALTVMLAGTLPARAANSQLLGMVSPDAKVLAGVNVDQAKATPFGQYVLSLLNSSQDQHLQELTALTGFDPTRDVREVLVASTAVPGVPGSHSGLFLASGFFDPAKITTAATAHNAKTESYKGVTVIEDPNGTNGVAFIDSNTVVAGDIASVKAAIDRKGAAPALPVAVQLEVNKWSSQDAWVVSLVPTASLKPPAGAPNVPGVGQGAGAFQSIQQAAGGVKFGTSVVITADAVADTAQNAQSMGDALKLLASLATMGSNTPPTVKTLVQSLKIGTSGTTLNVSMSLPEDQLQELLKPKPHTARPAAVRHGKKMRGR